MQARVPRRAERTEDAQAALCSRADSFVAEAGETVGSFISAHHFLQGLPKRSFSGRPRIPDRREPPLSHRCWADLHAFGLKQPGQNSPLLRREVETRFALETHLQTRPTRSPALSR